MQPLFDLFQSLTDCSCSLHTGSAGLCKTSGYARAVARREEAGELGLEVLVELEARRVKLDLRAVEKRVVVRRARGL